MSMIRVSGNADVASTSQSVRTEIEKAGQATVGAIGKDAIDKASRSVASANSMFGNRLVASLVYDKVEGRDSKVMTALRFIVKDPLHGVDAQVAEA